jgi:hypothetical protein
MVEALVGEELVIAAVRFLEEVGRLAEELVGLAIPRLAIWDPKHQPVFRVK